MQILKHVDVLDLIKIKVYNPSVYVPGAFAVEFEALEKGKVVVVDTNELQKLNRIVTERAQTFEDARDPKVKEFIKEFVGRMCSEWYKVGLLVIDEPSDAPVDHYEQAKKTVAQSLNKVGRR